MNGLLLTTKFEAPQIHPGFVTRPRLYNRLDAGQERRLTLLSAPAGFGKTALLSAWRMRHASEERPIGWFSLDESDNDAARFWAYAIAALQRVRAGIGEHALTLLDLPQTPIEAVLSSLVNDLAEMPHDLALVFDDYHLVEAEPIHVAVGFLLEHMPPQMHLIISGRADPPLALARLRARGQLTELRAADLRFTLGRRLPSSTTSWNSLFRRKTLARSKFAPRAGSPACNWRRSPCGSKRTLVNLSRPSPVAIDMSWTT